MTGQATRAARRIAATGLLAALACAVVATDAGAATAPAVTVTPSTGLVDGQSVHVVADGFLSAASSGGTFVPSAFECASVFPASAVVDLDTATHVISPLLTQYCTALGSFPVTQSSTSSRDVAVVRAFTPSGGSPVTCAAPGACTIVVVGVQPPFGALASVPISFAATPPSKAACTGGGWRQYVDARGGRLRNQGQCIRAARA